MNVALFGFMGVGKSAVGQLLAEELGLGFVDLDEEIVKRAGRDIPSIFREDGEAAFREMEKAVTRDVSALDRQIIACGGGTVLDSHNLERLKNSSIMILLTADPETILERIEAQGETRPLLAAEDRLERIRRLLTSRHPRYIIAADIVVDTSGKTPEQVEEEVMGHLQEAHAA
jgi:shikimate kinase